MARYRTIIIVNVKRRPVRPGSPTETDSSIVLFARVSTPGLCDHLSRSYVFETDSLLSTSLPSLPHTYACTITKGQEWSWRLSFVRVKSLAFTSTGGWLLVLFLFLFIYLLYFSFSFFRLAGDAVACPRRWRVSRGEPVLRFFELSLPLVANYRRYAYRCVSCLAVYSRLASVRERNRATTEPRNCANRGTCVSFHRYTRSLVSTGNARPRAASPFRAS